MWSIIHCIDREITIPIKFKNECKLLVEQEDCKDFNKVYIVNITSDEMWEAMELYFNSKGEILQYNKILDYLCYKNMEPITHQIEAEKFLRFIDESKKIQVTTKEIDLLTMKERITFKITDVQKDMYNNILYLIKHCKETYRIINKFIDVNFYINNQPCYLVKDYTDIKRIDIVINKINSEIKVFQPGKGTVVDL